MRRLISTAVMAALVLGLAACTAPGESSTPQPAKSQETSVPAVTEEPAPVLDLTGEWKQSNSNSAEAYQQASIADGVIRIDWVNEAESMTSVYWVGTFDAPTDSSESHSWDSINDTSQTANALLASGDPTKTFVYENGSLSYELTALGTTMTVHMTRQ